MQKVEACSIISYDIKMKEKQGCIWPKYNPTSLTCVIVWTASARYYNRISLISVMVWTDNININNISHFYISYIDIIHITPHTEHDGYWNTHLFLGLAGRRKESSSSSGSSVDVLGNKSQYTNSSLCSLHPHSSD